MGGDKLRYCDKFRGKWRYRPTKAMQKHGLRFRQFGAEMTTEDRQLVLALNDEWDRIRRALRTGDVFTPRSKYPPGSIGEAYERAIALRAKDRESKQLPPLTKEQESRDDWRRAWRWIEPLFGDVDPKTVQPEHLIDPDLPGLRPLVAREVSESEAHRVVKIWRALWQKLAVLGYCDKERDPSLTFSNSAPAPRNATWREGDVVRLAKAAWRTGYFGLAAIIAVAWDTQLSPVDVRGLTASQRRRDRKGTVFYLGRAKTGRAAAGTLSRRAERLLEAYLERQYLGVQLLGDAILFRNRSGTAYTKDTLGDDFRSVRSIVFGPADQRQLADMRRSGAVEAVAGGAKGEQLSAKMANTLSASNRLHKTYVPVDVAAVREVDDARRVGRTRIRNTEE